MRPKSGGFVTYSDAAFLTTTGWEPTFAPDVFRILNGINHSNKKADKEIPYSDGSKLILELRKGFHPIPYTTLVLQLQSRNSAFSIKPDGWTLKENHMRFSENTGAREECSVDM